MDVVGTALSAAQSLFAALQSSELKEILSIFGYKSQLDDLQRTVSTINAVFRDAETKQELTHEAQHWLEELKDAVFEADDLFDEFVTLAEQKQLVEAGGSLSKKMRQFFSDSNPLGIAYRMSRGVKKIKKKLDAIAYNHQFSFKIDLEPMKERRLETGSVVNAGDIIGREDDLEKIVGLLLDSNIQRDVSFLTIVGMGGLGKTALAQLVYNDPRVRTAFPLRCWNCVSDQDQKQLDVKEILGKILATATGKNHEGSTMDQVQTQLREQLCGKRYLLVLDDVWNENPNQLRDLVEFFMGGRSRNWIVVTTRSHETARIIRDGPLHKLQGLSEENSWRLFVRWTFGSVQAKFPNDFIMIARDIVDKCARNPLAIRVVGSLLCGQDKTKWLSFHEIGLGNIRKSHNDIMPILNLSYHHLEPPIKRCFSYCVVFPKDFLIGKQTLINLWMAQGYIVPLDKDQSIDDASEEYISILLRRCFFENVGAEKDGVIKIHDLMHDIAQNVMGKELCTTKNISGSLDKSVRHLSLARTSFARYSLNATHIRSYFCAGYWCQDAEINQFSVEALVPNCLYLRAMDLAWSKIKSLPDSIGGLLHLRYLDLSYNEDLEVLPNSIAKLYNLQTLQLKGCKRLEGLPKHLSRLVKLQTLDIHGCNNVTYMPKGMGKLTCLHTLSKFIVGGEGSCSSWKQCFDGLEDLKALNNLKGHLEIQIRWPKNTTDAVKEDVTREGLYLNHKEHLNHIVVDFRCEEGGGRMDDEEARRLMEELRPHPYLENLAVKAYYGVKMPGWATLLPNLTELFLSDCGELENLPCLGKLDHLKVLRLSHLAKLEYIEEDSSSANFRCRPGPESAGLSLYFPSLERLELKRLCKLKGWRRGEGLGDDHQPFNESSSNTQVQLQLCLPQLKSLRIERCPLLTFMPLCPKTEKLHLVVFNERLRIVHIKRDENFYAPLHSSSSDPENPRNTIPIPMFREVYINNVAWLNSLPMEAFRCLTHMTIKNDKVESLGEVGEVFRSCSSSLRSLNITGCSNLRSVSGGLEHLTALEMLEIHDTHKLSLSEDPEGVVPWKSLHHSLSYLQLMNLPQLVNLPDSMQFLAALQTLSIVHCTKLQSVPDWMPRLTSLRKLMVSFCSAHLERRCQNPTGVDWPNIQHIPSIDVTSSLPKFLVLPYE